MLRASKDRIIILDIDGTIVDTPRTYEISQEVKNAVSRLQNTHIVCLATGRPWRMTKEVVEELGITDPCIVLGGTEVVDSNGKILWEAALDDEQVANIVQALEPYKECGFLVDDYTLETYISGGDYTYQDLKSLKSPKVIEPVFIKYNVAKEIERSVSSIRGVVGVITIAHKLGYNDVHIMSSAATKEHAIAELLRITNVDSSRSTGVGDSLNDVHLFAAVNTKIAMGNAVPELKKAADRVIGDVADDGLAKYLNELSDEAA